ncbi:MAG: TlpA family protein disulfide reductase [Bacteroidales bacterium]|nr:TlpA family protein disulfide reductase [Bacteroidales bacterium]MBD5213078.1 TlpA family protein disulfide reductase [Bacteroidales bacterium]MBD5217977.1 TlpA family protein disulfide reductase [Bacteroidales bacterium]
MFKKFLSMALVVLASATAWAELPSVTLKDINGKTVNTAELSNDGKPIVISFFATWCKPCNRELAAIHEVFADWQDETGVKLVAVSIDEAQNAQKVKPLVERKGWTDYEVLLDPNGEFKRQMGVNDIPHAFIVDGNGNVVWTHQGYIDGGENDIYEELIKLTK